MGKAMAMQFAEEGCRVVICARQEAALQEAAREIQQRGAEVLALALDITRPEEALKLADETFARFGRIDILVNNAGGNRRGAFAERTDAEWEEVLALNLTAHVRVSRAVLPHMRAQSSGAIIFIASIFGRESGGEGLALYNTTKAGVISLAKIMAVELARDNIRVNSIAPGSIRFPGGSWDKRCLQDPQGMAEFVKREIPLGRFGTVEEVANVAAFLASERASWVSGACVTVDGCQSRSLI
ncbi:MAG: SDR family NAD(P)-dependent oxidoreductase [candidate division KSB1 bacterium]